VGVGSGVGLAVGDGEGLGLSTAHPARRVTIATAVTPRSFTGGFTALS
jgi:hypothetical protein